MAVRMLERPPSQDGGLSRLARRARNHRYDAEAQNVYGFALLTSGHQAESVEWLERACGLAPRVPAYHTNLAAALHQVGRWNEGLWHAHRAYELDPTNVMAIVNVGAFHYWLGEVEEA